MPNPPVISFVGKLVFEPSDPPRPFGVYVVQRVRPGLGNIMGVPDRSYQLRAWVKPIDPNTPAQQIRRGLFADSVHAWLTMDPADHDFWESRAAGTGHDGYHLFLSQYLLAGGDPALAKKTYLLNNT